MRHDGLRRSGRWITARRAGFAGLLSLSLVMVGGAALADNGDDGDDEGDGSDTSEESGDTPESAEIEISISNEATADFDRTNHWDLEKTGELVELVEGEADASTELRYTVTAWPSGFTYTNITIEGEITITRGDDGVDSPVTVTLDDEQVTLPGGASTTCEYNAPNTRTRQAPVATSAWPGQDAIVTYTCEVDGEIGAGQWSHAITGTWSTQGSSFEEPVTAHIPTFTPVDESVTVFDDKTDAGGDPVKLGAAFWNSDGGPTEFDYTLEKDGLELGVCTEVTNRAWIDETDDFAEITIEVCPEAAGDPEPLIGAIGDITRDVCEVTIPTEVSDGGDFGLEVWDDQKIIDEFSWTMEEAGEHDVTWTIARPALEAAPGVGFALIDGDGNDLDSVDPWEYPAEVAQQCYEAAHPDSDPTEPVVVPAGGPGPETMPDTGVDSAAGLAGAGILAALGAALMVLRRGLAAR